MPDGIIIETVTFVAGAGSGPPCGKTVIDESGLLVEPPASNVVP
jgi:hypothetical protein